MRITKIGYQKNYNIIGMQWEKIIMEGELEEGEDEMQAIQLLRTKCDQSAQQKINSLYQEQETTVWNSEVPNLGLQVTEPQEAIPSKKLSQEEVLAQLIEDATTLKALKWLEKPSEKYPKTKELYQNKLNQLTND